MQTPIADYEVHLQKGVRARVLAALQRAAKVMAITPEDLLDKIALAMKEVRNVGEEGPEHRTPEEEAVPAAYWEAYDSLHVEQYYGVLVSYGIQDVRPRPRLVIIDVTHHPVPKP